MQERALDPQGRARQPVRMTGTLTPAALAARPTVRSSSRLAVPAPALAVAAMLTVQLGAALSVHLFPVVGPAGTAWLRLCAASLVLLALVRPRVRTLPRDVLPAVAGLGAVSALMTVGYFLALERLPLGTTVALEFLGPLGVAVLSRGAGRAALLWPALALAGVLALTEPWSGGADPLGVGFALVAAGGWGGYVLLTQRVGDALPGLSGLALSMPVAALCAAPVGVPQAWGHLSAGVLLQAAALALLLPVVPYALEMVALRRMTTAAWGTLAAVEPAVAAGVGVLVLGQVPHVWQAGGVVLVVAAGLGAQRTGARGHAPA